jgi:2-oxoglutarate dehydrogenase E1 component
MSRRPAIPDAAPEFLEHMLERWRHAPDAVDRQWQDLFEGLGEKPAVRQGSSTQHNGTATGSAPDARLPALIEAYRTRGHLEARIDPLGLEIPEPHPDLDPENHGLSPADLCEPVDMGGVLGLQETTGATVLERLRALYCGTLGAEFMHLDDVAPRFWLQQAMETGFGIPIGADQRRTILDQILQAESFEEFMQVKFPTSKRYGLEGSESQLPMCESLLREAAANGADEIVLGPMHRGRTTFMATFMQKPLAAVFAEFMGTPWHPSDVQIAGDVTYHMGHSVDRDVDTGQMHISMASHPSHVETVIPVSLGKTRAKQALRPSSERHAVLGLMMHTDAGFAGQGVVAECFQLAALDGYGTGGTVHVIANNQIGFTTRTADARSSHYCSDIGKIVQAPVLHVNGDDPEAAVRAAAIAIGFWARFHRDIIIDLVCYRRHGHNELDEPRFTEPRLYRVIDTLPTTSALYAARLAADGIIDNAWLAARRAAHRRRWDAGFDAVAAYKSNATHRYEGRWQGLAPPVPGHLEDPPKTGVPLERLRDLGARLHRLPDGFVLHPNLARQLDARAATIETAGDITWATAELLALATLLTDGTPVRLTGEDTRRGTFSQRHAVLADQANGAEVAPLSTLTTDQAQFEIHDSPLSEEAVLGFEYGYALARPDALVLWEAQFGDFVNVAQVFIDHYIASGEEKWMMSNGLVLLLPHGLEGGGPEHSSARMERFLQLCARDNMQVVNCTTPANHFHCLRRQMLRPYRKPLIAMAPKLMLRHRAAVSALSDMATGTRFEPLIARPRSNTAANKASRVVLCSGRIYYDLEAERHAAQLEHIEIIRIEQLYPFPALELQEALAPFGSADVVWCQEEPENMGAWSFVDRRIERVLAATGHQSPSVRYAGRPASPTPAAATPGAYKREQRAVINAALR